MRGSHFRPTGNVARHLQYQYNLQAAPVGAFVTSPAGGLAAATGREEEARAALHRVSELHTTSLEVDRKMHEAMVSGAR